MDIDELRRRRKVLEDELTTFIAEKLVAFHIATGVAIMSVDIDLIRMGIIGTREVSYFLDNVSCEIAI